MRPMTPPTNNELVITTLSLGARQCRAVCRAGTAFLCPERCWMLLSGRVTLRRVPWRHEPSPPSCLEAANPLCRRIPSLGPPGECRTVRLWRLWPSISSGAAHWPWRALWGRPSAPIATSFCVLWWHLLPRHWSLDGFRSWLRLWVKPKVCFSNIALELEAQQGIIIFYHKNNKYQLSF